MSTYYPRKTSIFILSCIHFLERFSYWGIRSFIILYTTSNQGFNWESDDSFYYYGLMFSLMVIVSLPLGIFTDFVLKQKNGLLLGGLMAFIGYTLLLTHNELIFWGSFALIILGSALVRVNLIVLLGRLFHKSERKRDLSFIIHHYISSLAGFLSGITIGFIALDYEYGWNYGFIAISLSTLAYLLGFFFTRNKLELKEENLDYSKKYIPVSTTPDYQILDAKDLNHNTVVEVSESEHKKRKWYPFSLILILIIVFSLYQQLAEMATMAYANFSAANALGDPGEISFFDLYLELGLSFVIGVSFFSICYIKGLGSTLSKITYSFFFMGISFLLLYNNGVFLGENLFASSTIPLITISIADVLISPILLSYITRLSDNRYSSTIVGLYFGAAHIVGILLNNLLSIRNVDQSLIPGIIVTVGLFFAFALFKSNLLKLSNGLD